MSHDEKLSFPTAVMNFWLLEWKDVSGFIEIHSDAEVASCLIFFMIRNVQ